MNYNGKSNI